MRRSQFAGLPVPARRALFLGDSITELGLSHEWFPQLPTLDRGVGGETVAEVSTRLDTAVNDPSVVSLLVGTNDLTSLGASRRPRDIAADLGRLLTELRRRVPSAPILVNSVMPRTARFVTALDELNTQYRDLAHRYDCHHLDLQSVLADDRGRLRSVLTADGLHLNGAGYAVWTGELRRTGLFTGEGRGV